MPRPSAALIAAAVLGAVTLSAAAQSGIPEDLTGYRTWTRMNAALMTDPSNPRAGPKNTFVNLSSDALREVVAPGARVRKAFPTGTILVRETLDPVAGFVRVLFVMRKDTRAAGTRGWVFSGFSRNTADQAFQPLAIPEPVMRCLACHLQMKATDFVFQPFTNRTDRLPVRPFAGAEKIETLNYRFAPEVLRVKAGATVTWVNYDAVVHDVKAADRSFESGNLPTQARYFFTFSRPGTFEYFCAVHLEMRGRVVVEP